MSKSWKKNKPTSESDSPDPKHEEFNPTLNVRRSQAATKVGLEIQHSQIKLQGPLPHSSEIRAYDELYPGAAKLLFENFEAQSKHRRMLEEFAVRAEAHERIRALELEAREILTGQLLAFGCVLLFVSASCYAFYLKQEWAGALLASLSVGGIVTTFVVGRNRRSDLSGDVKAAEQKREADEPSKPTS